MKKVLLLLLISFITSCTTKKDVIYLNNLSNYENSKIKSWNLNSTIQINEVLQIAVASTQPEVAIAFNKISQSSTNTVPNIEMLQLSGYLVDVNYFINFPIIGLINVKDKTYAELQVVICDKLTQGSHLIDPLVSVRCLNAKFTVLGEVNRPGTFKFLEQEVTLLQALGYAGGLNIFAKKNKISIIREVNGQRNTALIDLTSTKTLDSPYFYLKNNDVIIINPNYNRVKSAGFIGSPQTISSIASILLSATILILNQN